MLIIIKQGLAQFVQPVVREADRKLDELAGQTMLWDPFSPVDFRTQSWLACLRFELEVAPLVLPVLTDASAGAAALDADMAPLVASVD